MIHKWKRINKRNKFLIGVTDKMQSEFDLKVANLGCPITKSKLYGLWEMGIDKDMVYTYHFERNNSLTYKLVNYFSTNIYKGKLTCTFSLQGKWSITHDSLIIKLDPMSLKIDVDSSNINAIKNMADSVNKIIDFYKSKEYLNIVRSDWTEIYNRAYKSVLDESGTQMEWCFRRYDEEGNVIEISEYLEKKDI